MIEVTQNDLARVVQTNKLDSLPIINRTFASLAALSPGVLVNNGTITLGDSLTAATGCLSMAVQSRKKTTADKLYRLPRTGSRNSQL